MSPEEQQLRDEVDMLSEAIETLTERMEQQKLLLAALLLQLKKLKEDEELT